MNGSPIIETSLEPPAPPWLGRMAFPLLVLLFFLTQALLGFAVYRPNYWLAVPLVLFSSHLMHGLLIGFHEASHGHLRKSRLLNEFDGVLIGIFSLTSFSLYRVVHQWHHAYLVSERDEEFWPFVHPRVSRGARLLAAFLELTVGLVYTPLLFLRPFLRRGSPIRNKKLRRRIWMECGLMAVVWAALLAALAVFSAWKYFLWLYVIPALLAANMQSFRKFVEHVGLTGSTVNGSTRSIVAEGWVAAFLNFTMLHEPYHGVHHWRSGLPHPELPHHVAALEPAAEKERPPFRTFGAAVRDMFIHLPDPQVGPQWLGTARPTRQELVRQHLNS